VRWLTWIDGYYRLPYVEDEALDAVGDDADQWLRLRREQWVDTENLAVMKALAGRYAIQLTLQNFSYDCARLQIRLHLLRNNALQLQLCPPSN
jgi:hypothetical protein